eukprot:COSAG03_NODE_607_length_6733_cov_37.369913_3_plen_193_part_00
MAAESFSATACCAAAQPPAARQRERHRQTERQRSFSAHSLLVDRTAARVTAATRQTKEANPRDILHTVPVGKAPSRRRKSCRVCGKRAAAAACSGLSPARSFANSARSDATVSPGSYSSSSASYGCACRSVCQGSEKTQRPIQWKSHKERQRETQRDRETHRGRPGVTSVDVHHLQTARKPNRPKLVTKCVR